MTRIQNPYRQARKVNEDMNPQKRTFKAQKTLPSQHISSMHGINKNQVKTMKTSKIEEDEKQVEIQLAQQVYPISQNPPLIPQNTLPQDPPSLQTPNPFAAKSSLPAVQPEPGTISQILEGMDESAINKDKPENQIPMQPKQGSGSKPEDNKDEMEGVRNVGDSFNF